MKHEKLPEEIAKRISQTVFDAIEDEATQQLLVDVIQQALEAEEREKKAEKEASRLRVYEEEALKREKEEKYQEELDAIIGHEYIDETSENLTLEPVGPDLAEDYINLQAESSTRVRRDGEFHKIQNILKYAERWLLMPSSEEQDIDSFIDRIRPQIFELTERRMQEAYNTGMRISYSLEIIFRKPKDDRFEYITAPFRAKPMKILHIAQLHNNFNADVWGALREAIAKFTNKGSGWTIHRITRFDVHLSIHKQYVGGSYLSLPRWVSYKGAIVNPKNSDQECFKWAVLTALHAPAYHPERIIIYKKYESHYNWDGLDFPMHKDDIGIFEKDNPGIKINLYSISRKTPSNRKSESICVLRHAPMQKKDDKIINLLLVWPSDEEETEDEEFYGKAHFCWIKDMSRFTRGTTNKEHKNFVCSNCCNGFASDEKLQNHFEVCIGQKAQQIKYPSLDKNGEAPKLKFVSRGKDISRYYVLADLEADVKKIRLSRAERLNQRKEPTPPKTYKHSVHKVNSYNFTIVDRENPDGSVIRVGNTTRRQEEIVPEMLKRLKEYANNLLGEKEKLNVFFHNLRGYDSHHILQYIEDFSKISCIPDNMERYKCVTVDRVVFKDSLQFLPAPLEKLVSNFPREQFKITQKFFGGESLDLVMRKGVYPYKWKVCEEQFKAKKLPPIQAFYNDLTDTPCTPEDYAHAQAVWKHFEMKTFQDYHDLYLETDVLLLADVFNAFCDIAIRDFGIDPCNYVSLPSYAFDAMLKYTGAKPELLTDPDMYLFFEKGLRGGITTAIHKYAKANNPLVPGYDPSKKTSFIIYMDKNNLYGHAMCQKLPYRKFQWVSEKELVKFNEKRLKSYNFDGNIGYVFEIDAYVPKKLHDKHSDFPLAPEHRTVAFEELSSYTKELAELLDTKPGNNKKLMCTLYEKKKYVVHGKTLQLYVNEGLKVSKIHRAVQFEQKAWLKPYIDRNTAKRAEATTDFDKDFYKLMNNSVFGKTMENMRMRVNIKLAGPSQLAKMLCKPNVEHINIISNNLAAVQLKKESLLMDKPIQIGFAILDLSKCEMYDYHYNYMLERYPGMRVSLLYTDTDSFVYLVETEDIYADMKEDSHMFDFSGYPRDHTCYSVENKKVVGKMKDEMNGVLISEFVGLKAKMYALDTQHSDEKKKEIRKAKGVQYAFVKNKMTFQMYKDTLDERQKTYCKTSKIQSKTHQLYTQTQTKVALSPYDDKRYVLDDGIRTLAYGHYKIPT